jgi:hypothetical protein
VHPFAAVKVTVYTPGVVTEIVGFTLIGVGFVQEMVPTPFAVNEILVVVHVSTLVIGGVIDNVGAVLF